MNGTGRKVLFVTLLAVVVYAGVAFASDVRALQRHLQAFEWWTLAGAFALAFANYVLRFFKWQFYLRRLDVGVHAPGEPYRALPFGENFAIYLSGFVMSITPGKAGEVFKSVLLASARGVPVERTAPVVIADRLTDLLSLIVLVAIGSASFPGYGWIALIGSAMVAGVLFFVAFERVTLALLALLGRVKAIEPILPRLRDAYAALRTVSTPGALVWASTLSLAAWALECAALALILSGLGVQVSLPLAFFTYATATIAGAIAMLPGGLGGTEFTMRQMLTQLGGIAAAPAGAATLLVRFATLWFAVIVGFVALAVFRRRYDRGLTPAARTVATSQADAA